MTNSFEKKGITPWLAEVRMNGYWFVEERLKL